MGLHKRIDRTLERGCIMGMHDNAVMASMRFLESIGYDELQVFEGHIVARDGDELVFITVGIVEEFGGLLEPRSERENLAFRFLDELGPFNLPIRFDDWQMRVCFDGQGAMVRHHVNCMADDADTRRG